jgi:UDP-N-acetylmuramoyl-tripeptide--D-alanyl-D-alanine ligase
VKRSSILDINEKHKKTRNVIKIMNTVAIHSQFLETTGPCTDTRNILLDSMFFALKGGNFNGNEFALKAIEDGCKYAIVDEKKYAIDERFILVNDVLEALQDLANYHRKQFTVPVIAITGSNGKTTTKELIGAILETTYKTLYTKGNLNNHIGVPLTLLELNKSHEVAIIEMGANKPGDIKELAEIAEPSYGIITNIGTAHIEGFGSLEGVISTKKELYDFILKVKGKIFINHEDKLLNNIAPKSVSHITYGEQEISYIYGELTQLTPFVHLEWRTSKYVSPIIETKLVGKYNFTNFLAAIAVGLYLNVDKNEINEALTGYNPSNNRSQVKVTLNNTIIVDCYNANPSSMLSALESFKEIENGNKVAILGDMLELGNISQLEHQKTVDYLKKHTLKAYLVGPEFEKTNTNNAIFITTEELISYLESHSLSDSLILLKGSRGIQLEKVLEMKNI